MNNLTPKQIPHPWTPSDPGEMAWYVPAWNPGYYLHRDGVVRRNIFHHAERLGYFKSEADALAAIAKFEAKQEATQ